MNGLALCAGIGGLELGVRLAADCRTVCYVEREAFAAAVLVARMEAAQLDRAPVADDLRSFDGCAWRGVVDLVTAGYPCQPFSVAGKRLGDADERHLWPEVRRILDECGAPLAVLENVPGHVGVGLADVLGDLAALGCDAEWGLFSAAEVGAPHLRERLFVLAYRGDDGRRLIRSALDHDGRDARGDESDGCDPALGDAGCERLDRPQPIAEPRRRDPSRAWAAGDAPAWPPRPDDAAGWARWRAAGGPLPVLRRGLDGAADWMDRADRLRALGNGVVPLAAAHAFRTLARRALT